MWFGVNLCLCVCFWVFCADGRVWRLGWDVGVSLYKIYKDEIIECKKVYV
jgi:hypothetical protein